MKSLLSVFLIGGSALLAERTLISSSDKGITGKTEFFTCNINGKKFIAINDKLNDSSLAATFTYADNNTSHPASIFISADATENNPHPSFFIQPINDDAPATVLTMNTNLYNNYYITYKASENSFYNTTTQPGNFEITGIDTLHKTITAKLNCILYSSAEKDWLLVTNGRLKLNY